MQAYPGPHFLGGRTERVNELAHVSLLSGRGNTSVGLNTDHADRKTHV